jgi:hypothetical protein
MPGLVEGDDDGLYVVKFRGAGQGPKSLVAEVLVGELARAAGLPVPELVLVDVPADLARAEPDPEIQDLVMGSGGLNAGLDFLPGALAYTPAAEPAPSPELAADVVWFDALTTNVDRSPRNVNLLAWHGALWLIDHGAALYLQHGGLDPVAHAARPFPVVRDHVLLPLAASVLDADARLAPRLGPDVVAATAALVPDAWLDGDRDVYVDYLVRRLTAPRGFAAEAEEARRALA